MSDNEKKRPTNDELAKGVIPEIAKNSHGVFFRITETNSGYYLMIGRGQYGSGHVPLMETADPVRCREDIIGLISKIIFGVISRTHDVDLSDLGKVVHKLAFSDSAPLHAQVEEAVLSR